MFQRMTGKNQLPTPTQAQNGTFTGEITLEGVKVKAHVRTSRKGKKYHVSEFEREARREKRKGLYPGMSIAEIVESKRMASNLGGPFPSEKVRIHVKPPKTFFKARTGRKMPAAKFVEQQSPRWQAEYKRRFDEPLRMFWRSHYQMKKGKKPDNPLRSGSLTGPIVTKPGQAYMIARSMQYRWAKQHALKKGILLEGSIDHGVLMQLTEQVMTGNLTMDQAVSQLNEDVIRRSA